MTAPAYHVGQILYHRANGERAIVTKMKPGEVHVSPCVKDVVILHLSEVELIFSTEPIVGHNDRVSRMSDKELEETMKLAARAILKGEADVLPS